MYSATLLTAATLALSHTSAAKAPWTCLQLESYTDPFYRMLPAFLGAAKLEDEDSLVQRGLFGHCFMNITAFTTYTWGEQGELKAQVTFDLEESLGLCTEHLQVSTAFSDYYDFYMMSGQKEINLTFEDQWEVEDIRQNGLRFFTYCADPFTFLQSTVTTAFMWVGGMGTSKYLPMFGDKPTVYQKEANSLFLEQFTGLKLQERIINFVDVDPALMETGDILVGRRFSGNGAEWMVLDGGYASHVAMIVQESDGTKSVIDCPGEVGEFSETRGVSKTDLSDWLSYAMSSDYDIAWLPLNKKMRAHSELDQAALDDWLLRVEGSPYSRVQRFFAAIDTADESFPPPLNAEIYPILLRLYAKYTGKLAEAADHMIIEQFHEALQIRIQSVLTPEQQETFVNPVDLESLILYASQELKLSLTDLTAIPETDEWRYESYGGLPVFTPASFVVSALEKLGVFHGAEINATEFTVKDVYQLDIFEKNFRRPDLCNEADYLLPYCQLFGTSRLELPGYSTINPYEHMNEQCPNAFESAIRPHNC